MTSPLGSLVTKAQR